MTNNHQYTLEKYKGRRTRHTCPACGKRHEFTRYVHAETEAYLAENVGKCNRENKCGYHYPPAQYFRDHPEAGDQPEKDWRYSEAWKTIYAPPQASVQYLPREVLKRTLTAYEVNNFVRFLVALFGQAKALELAAKYQLGTSNKFQNDGGKAVVFWQIDRAGNIRQAKVMAYRPRTGRRVKAEGKSFVAFAGKTILKNRDAHLQQCFFGEHLLAEYPNLPVALVESEKTAVIMTGYLPKVVWLAAGGKNGARWTDRNVYQALEGRRVAIYPDLGAFEEWAEKAKILGTVCDYKLSRILEQNAKGNDRQAGYDIADYFIKFKAQLQQSATQVKPPTLPSPQKANPRPDRPNPDRGKEDPTSITAQAEQPPMKSKLLKPAEEEKLPPGWKYEHFSNGHKVLLDADDLPALWNLKPKSELERRLIKQEALRAAIQTNPAVGELAEGFGLEVTKVERWEPEEEKKATKKENPETESREKTSVDPPVQQKNFFDEQTVDDPETLERLIRIQEKAVERARLSRKERENKILEALRVRLSNSRSQP